MIIHIRKIEEKTLAMIIIIWLFAFQRALVSVSNIFGYIDEVFALFALSYICVRWFKEKAIKKTDFVLLALMFLLVIEGIISNMISGLLTNVFAVGIDIVSTFKVLLIYIWAKNEVVDSDAIIVSIARFARCVVVIAFVCMLISQVTDIGMSDSARYGIKSFKFVFDNAGNFSKFFYFLIPVMTIDLKYDSGLWKKIMIALACVCWLSTLRSRAFSFVALYLLFCYVYFKRKDIAFELKSKWYYGVILIAVALFFSWDQLMFYFTTSTQARAVLLKYSFVTLAEYFPLGSGFGTYGSDIAIDFYSELYSLYGFSRIYGIGLVHTNYLNDNYWPMIIAQFGVIGTGIMLFILWMIHKEIIQKAKRDKYCYFAALCALLFLLISSVASKSYSEYSSICVFMLLGIMTGQKQEKE